MSEPQPFSVSAVQKKREQAGSPAGPVAGPDVVIPPGRTAAPAAEGQPVPEPEKAGGGLPFDPARLILALIRGWYWAPLVGLVLGAGLGLYGHLKFQTGYFVDVQLIRREVTTTIRASQFGEAFKPQSPGVATVISLMQSSKLLERVGSEANPPIDPDALLHSLVIKQEKDTDLIDVDLKTKSSPSATADLINLYCKEVAAMTGQMQADEAAQFDAFLRDQLAKTDLELEAVNKELLDFRRDNNFFGEDRELEAYLRQLGDAETQLESVKTDQEATQFRMASIQREMAQQNPIALQLDQARNQLANLRESYTDDNPIVKDALDKVANLEAQQAAWVKQGTNQVFEPNSSNPAATELYNQLIDLRDHQSGLAKQMVQLNQFRDSVQEKLKAIPEKSQHYAEILARQTSLLAGHDLLAGRQHEAQIYEDNPPGLYRIFAPATPDSVEESSRNKKIIIVTVVGFVLGIVFTLVTLCGRELMNLRVVSAGDLRRCTGVPVAVRIPDLDGMDPVSLGQWRFRAWAQLLRQLNPPATACVTIAVASAKPGEGKSYFIRLMRDAARDRQLNLVSVTNAPGTDDSVAALPLADALNAPDLVIRHLREHPGRPLELTFGTDWRWSLENRARWQRAVEVWQSAPAFTLLVELPAMADLEVLLVAELMPQVVWLAASNALEQRELAQPLELVAAGEIRLSAAVLNREPALFAKLSFLQRFGLFLLLAGSLAGTTAGAATAVTNGGPITITALPTNSTASLSYNPSAPQLASWQQRLTVGPGDVFNFNLYGKLGTTRPSVAVGADGRVSFLEAQSIYVAGLTVDEMRARLDEVLARYYKHPRTIAEPVTWRSKKYFMLGAVTAPGSYELDRPITVIEAVARAHGIATGFYVHNTIELADLTRSFLIRNNHRVPVDFDSLFNKGDLTQNVLVEPGDYLYFPSGSANEVYVLGAVMNPGPLGLSAENTLFGVLTVRGGFAPNAYRQHVLVVRGSLNHPQTFVVDVSDILVGRGKDFLLQPKDIVYVANKPWQRAEELTQMAATSFVQAMTATWIGNHVGTINTGSLLP